MKKHKEIPIYFSLAAAVITIIMSIINRITIIRTVLRIIPAASIFYILGLLFSKTVLKDISSKPEKYESIDIAADEDEEFQELELPVVDEAERKVVGRG
jgi:hypothetical protein